MFKLLKRAWKWIFRRKPKSVWVTERDGVTLYTTQEQNNVMPIGYIESVFEEDDKLMAIVKLNCSDRRIKFEMFESKMTDRGSNTQKRSVDT
jgi:hypothetical protein